MPQRNRNQVSGKGSARADSRTARRRISFGHAAHAEMNTLYDLPGEVLRSRRQLLRLRKYGSAWTLTHKSGTKRAATAAAWSWKPPSPTGRRWTRSCARLGYAPTFRYEKFRAEWTRRQRAGGRRRDSDRKFLRDRRPAALDRRDGEEVGGESARLHHQELRDIVCGLEGRTKVQRKR